MKCALEMIETTKETRENAVIEEEKRKRGEERKLQILTAKNTEKFAEKILTKFEKLFKTFTGHPANFIFEYKTLYSTGLYNYKIGRLCDNAMYKVYVSKKCAYRDGDDSYDFDTSTIINIDYLKEIFKKLCYKFDIHCYCDPDIRHFGCGAIKLIKISISLDPTCL